MGVWWGEAPEGPCGKTGEPGAILPQGVDRPRDVPSRGRALGHGSARFQAYQCLIDRIISRSGSIIGPFGSLAPPDPSPYRPIAGAPIRPRSPFRAIRPFAMLLPYDDPSRCN